jgi:hypothetical protein
LSDERLFDAYLAEREGQGVNPLTAEHFADCPSCALRFAELALVLDEVRSGGESEADEVFTPERLMMQQGQIAERLRAIGHAGRVISFPTHAESSSGGVVRVPVERLSRVAAGWMAAAAGVGLFIGASVGVLYNGSVHARTQESVVVQPAASPAPAPVRTEPTLVDDDAKLMSELEAVRDRPRTEELMAFDALTPHTREINYLLIR